MKISNAYALPLMALLTMQPAIAETTAKEERNIESYADGLYIGGQLGYAKTDVSSGNLDQFYQNAGLDAASTKVDTSDIGYSLFLGYKFNPYISLEAGYQDLGDRSVHFSGTTTNPDAYYELAEHVYPETGDGLSLSLLGTIPFDNGFSITGKLGYFDWELDAVTYELSGGSAEQRGDDSRKDSGIWYGAELGYQIDYDLQAYLSYQHMPLQRDDVGVVSLGLRYWFGEEKTMPKRTKPTPKVAQVITRSDSDKDGINDNQDTCPNTSLLHAVDSRGCTRYKDTPVEMAVTIFYANNSDVIAPEYNEKISKLAKFVNDFNVKSLNVIGHTSASGTEEYNQSLSIKRAQSVANELVSQFKIDRNIIHVIGRGETELTSNIPSENRRIEVKLHETVRQPIMR